MIKRLSIIYGWTVVSIIFLAIIISAFWLLYPYKILVFNEGNGTLVKDTVIGGNYAQMRQNQCKYEDISAEINRQFIDTFIYQLPIVKTQRPTGCHESIEYIYVPPTLPSGDYYIRTVISYRVNPIRVIQYTVVSSKLTVINPNGESE